MEADDWRKASTSNRFRIVFHTMFSFFVQSTIGFICLYPPAFPSFDGGNCRIKDLCCDSINEDSIDNCQPFSFSDFLDQRAILLMSSNFLVFPYVKSNVEDIAKHTILLSEGLMKMKYDSSKSRLLLCQAFMNVLFSSLKGGLVYISLTSANEIAAWNSVKPSDILFSGVGMIVLNDVGYKMYSYVQKETKITFTRKVYKNDIKSTLLSNKERIDNSIFLLNFGVLTSLILGTYGSYVRSSPGLQFSGDREDISDRMVLGVVISFLIPSTVFFANLLSGLVYKCLH